MSETVGVFVLVATITIGVLMSSVLVSVARLSRRGPA